MACLKKRGKVYWIRWYEGEKRREQSLQTTSRQVANAKFHKFEFERAQGIDNPLPTRTDLGAYLGAYVRHMRQLKTPKSAQIDVCYLRQMFGVVCPELEDTSRTPRTPNSPTARVKRPAGKSELLVPPLCVRFVEQITAPMATDFIAAQVRTKGLKPKTANRYREILHRVIQWGIKGDRLRMPGGINPISRVERYKEAAPDIRYLTLPQIDEQLKALRFTPWLQVMVATLIYAGIRREELLWLRTEDLIAPSAQCPNGLLQIRAKTINGQSWQPKTNRNRAVPVSSELRARLTKWMESRPENEWLFPSPRGTRWDPDNFSHALAKANRSAGLVWTCLDYRHTFGSHLAQRGLSLYQIATLLGNSPEICKRHYASLIPESMGAYVDFMTTTRNHSLLDEISGSR
jgi:integrase